MLELLETTKTYIQGRRTVSAVESSSLELESLEMREFPTLTAALVRPLAVGAARRPA